MGKSDLHERICPRCGSIEDVSVSRCLNCGLDFAPLKAEEDAWDARCSKCGVILESRPVIIIVDLSNQKYCYKCAKEEVSELYEYRTKEISKIRDALLPAYEIEQRELQRWKTNQEEYLKKHNTTRHLLAAVIVCASIALSPIMVALAFPLYLVIIYIYSINLEAFDDRNPKPLTPTHLPDIDPQEIQHYAWYNPKDAHKRSTRKQILERDEYYCQWCGSKEPSSNLEVHHVTPRSQGGDDSPSNLVTLCIPCHKDEDWYGHVHKYADY